MITGTSSRHTAGTLRKYGGLGTISTTGKAKIMNAVLVKNADRMMTSAEPLLEGIEITFADGQKGLVPFAEIPEVKESKNLTSVDLPNLYEVILLTATGDTVELPWDFVRHYCDASYQPRIESVSLAGRQSVGARIRQLRQSAQLTQEALAQAGGIGRVTLVRIENGEQSPRYETLTSLAQALGRSLAELVVKEDAAAAPRVEFDYSQESHEVMDIGGITFRSVSDIIAVRESSGGVKDFDPAPRYNNVNGLALHPYGKGPFCRFRIQKRGQPDQLDTLGVYAIVGTDRRVFYVGKCSGRTSTLKKRFNNGYGHISPRNCYMGGQSTNCYVNREILNLLKEGKALSVFFHHTLHGGGASRIEAEVLNKIKNPPWNRNIPTRNLARGTIRGPSDEVIATGVIRRRRADIAGPTREEAIKSYFEPARQRGDTEAIIVSDDIQKALRLSGRHAAICNALSDKKGLLAQIAKVELITIEGTNPSSTTRFIFGLL